MTSSLQNEVRDILLVTSGLLDSPTGWCKNSFAKDSKNKTFCSKESSRKLNNVARCLDGALDRATVLLGFNKSKYDSTVRVISKVLGVRGKVALWRWNDNVTTTHEDVKELILKTLKQFGTTQ